MPIVSTLLSQLREPTIFTSVIPNKIKEILVKYIIDRKYKNNPKDFFFVQIGSNDGVSGDPIYKFIKKYNWKGILVEPVPYLFKKLQSTHAHQNGLILENVAIHKESGYQEFFRIEENNEPNNPSWYDKIGSFDKNVLLRRKHLIPNFDKHFITEKIKCITFSELLKKHKVEKIDLLNTDTEGYDYEIIKMLNLGEIKPRMILFECKHLSQEDKNAYTELLRQNNYRIIFKGGETFAYLDY